MGSGGSGSWMGATRSMMTRRSSGKWWIVVSPMAGGAANAASHENHAMANAGRRGFMGLISN
jgi:hypothetical protein